MTTTVPNGKLAVTQNRIGRLKKRISQIKMVGGKMKDSRKPVSNVARVYEDEPTQIPPYKIHKSTSKKVDNIQPPRQPLRCLQLNQQPQQYSSGYYEPDPARCQAEPYHATNNRGPTVPEISAQYGQSTIDYDREDYSRDYWPGGDERSGFSSKNRYEFYSDNHGPDQKRAVGIVPPYPNEADDIDIDLGSLGISLRELFPSGGRGGSNQYDKIDWYKSDEYRDDIIDYIMEQDVRYTVKSISFIQNGDIQANMRTILIDWLIQVQVHQDLLDETLHQTVALIDRYHSIHIVSLPKYQLLGIACLFVAAKYCERFPPLIADLLKLTENTYTTSQLLAMERKILVVLKFDLLFCDPTTFMECYLHMFGYHDDKKVRYLSMYLIDLSLTEPGCIIYRRADLVMTVVCLSIIIVDDSMTYNLVSQHCNEEIATTICRVLLETSTSDLTAAKVKFSSMSRYSAISHLPAITTSRVVNALANLSQKRSAIGRFF